MPNASAPVLAKQALANMPLLLGSVQGIVVTTTQKHPRTPAVTPTKATQTEELSRTAGGGHLTFNRGIHNAGRDIGDISVGLANFAKKIRGIGAIAPVSEMILMIRKKRFLAENAEVRTQRTQREAQTHNL